LTILKVTVDEVVKETGQGQALSVPIKEGVRQTGLGGALRNDGGRKLAVVYKPIVNRPCSRV
jgi:hypothetical protein